MYNYYLQDKQTNTNRNTKHPPNPLVVTAASDDPQGSAMAGIPHILIGSDTATTPADC